MREFLAINKALQSTQGELLNNTSKLTYINKRIERDTKKLEKVENDPTYTDEQSQLYRDRLDNLNTEKQARLETLSQNRKDLQTQVARIKQTIAKVLDQDTLLAQRIRILFKGQGITIFSILAAFSITILTIFLAITGVFGGGKRRRRRFFTKRRKGLGWICWQMHSKDLQEGPLRHCGECCWGNFKFPWKGCWLCCRACMGRNCFCCRVCWLVVDAKS